MILLNSVFSVVPVKTNVAKMPKDSFALGICLSPVLYASVRFKVLNYSYKDIP